MWDGSDGLPLLCSWWFNCALLDMCEREVRGIKDERVVVRTVGSCLSRRQETPMVRPLTGWEFPGAIIGWNMRLTRRPDNVRKLAWWSFLEETNPCLHYHPQVTMLYRDDMEVFKEEEWPIMNMDRMEWYLTHLHKGFTLRASAFLSVEPGV